MARGEQAENLGVRLGLAQRLDRRVVGDHVVVPVRPHHIEVFELCRRRQHDVRIIGRVGAKLLQYDGEQVLARETRATRAESGATATGFEL